MPNQGEKPVFLQLIWIAEARNVHEELVVPQLFTWVELNVNSSCGSWEGYLGLTVQFYRYCVDLTVRELTVCSAEMPYFLIRNAQRDVDEGDFGGFIVEGRDRDFVVFVSVVWWVEVVSGDVCEVSREFY